MGMNAAVTRRLYIDVSMRRPGLSNWPKGGSHASRERNVFCLS